MGKEITDVTNMTIGNLSKRWVLAWPKKEVNVVRPACDVVNVRFRSTLETIHDVLL